MISVLRHRIALFFLVSFGAIGAWAQADATLNPQPCIEWNIKPNQQVNRRQAERLYGEACRWVTENIPTRKKPSWPCIAVKVGQPCPDPAQKGSCVNPVTEEIFIPTWQSASAATVAQGTISIMLLHLLEPNEITRIAAKFLSEDESGFFDVLTKRAPAMLPQKQK